MTDPRMTPTNDAPVTVEECVTKIMDERVAYFERTTGHFDRVDAARSYRATKAELMKGLAALASAPAGLDARTLALVIAAREFYEASEEKCSDEGHAVNHALLPFEEDVPYGNQPASAPAGDGVPDGWQLVPSEPTETMLHAAYLCGDGGSPKAAYEAMLAAAPAALARPRAAVGEREV